MASVRIELLSRDNYDSWRIQAHALLIKSDVWGYVDGSIKKPAEPAEALLWEAADAKARAEIILSISPGELRHIKGTSTSRECWFKLESIFASSGPAKKATLLKQLILHKMCEEDDMREYLLSFFEAKEKLLDMDININNDLASIILLYSLPPSYENFRCAMETRDSLPDPNSLKVKILEEDASRRQQRKETERGRQQCSLGEKPR
ncbi:unnamed protein product [Pieris macdunnoughi]|uniref:Uncharacterized protein n=1 Tax=Pieris macdunnoughi TaxID=345717 RepID=A0A821TWN8_9NEOP|nr:unnamed protein product [Pieris macdunnoughi]